MAVLESGSEAPKFASSVVAVMNMARWRVIIDTLLQSKVNSSH